MEERFEVIYTQKLRTDVCPMLDAGVEILRDKQTGVMYVCRSSRGVGMTVLVDKDGKPLTTFEASI